MKCLFSAAAAAAAVGSFAVTLPANTSIVSGSFVRTPPASDTVAMAGGLDSTWRMFASYAAEKFWARKPTGLVITFM